MAGSYDLTDHEGTFLSLVLRIQPVTAYQVIKVYEESPVSNFNTSKGKIYPLDPPARRARPARQDGRSRATAAALRS